MLRCSLSHTWPSRLLDTSYADTGPNTGHSSKSASAVLACSFCSWLWKSTWRKPQPLGGSLVPVPSLENWGGLCQNRHLTLNLCHLPHEADNQCSVLVTLYWMDGRMDLFSKFYVSCNIILFVNVFMVVKHCS